MYVCMCWTVLTSFLDVCVCVCVCVRACVRAKKNTKISWKDFQLKVINVLEKILRVCVCVFACVCVFVCVSSFESTKFRHPVFLSKRRDVSLCYVPTITIRGTIEIVVLIVD